MFSGDATDSTLTLSTLGESRRSRLRWRDLLVFMVLWIGLFFRIVALSIWETVLEMYDHLQAIQDTLDIVNGKWKIAIIGALSVGNRRLMVLQREVAGIGAKMLSKELQELELNELVTRTVYNTKPVTVMYELTDYGTHSTEPVDYPLFIRPVAQAVAAGAVERGIVLGGSGNGEAIVANRITGVRCTLCWNLESATLARRHNDANVLSLGERLIAEPDVLPIVQVWLTTAFEGGRHQRRIDLIDR
jgi:ribose 5-phosphate isomerase B